MEKIYDNLYRGTRCSPQEIINAGINFIVDLEWGFSNLMWNDEYDNFDFYAHDITVVKIRMSDFFAPSLEQRARAINTVHKASKRGYKILIHCFSGKDRTGVVVMDCRRAFECFTFQQAYEEWVKEGRHFWYDWWKHYLIKEVKND